MNSAIPVTDPENKTESVAADLAENLEIWRTAFAIRMDKFEQALEENTATTERVDLNTRELVSILNSWKGAMKVIEFLAKLGKPIAAALGVMTAWWAWRSQK